MTIPTRPAPPPPIHQGTSPLQQQIVNEIANVEKLVKLQPPTNKSISQQRNRSHSITRHFPKAKVNSDLLDAYAGTSKKKGPVPPRPPPPKTAAVLKKPNAPPTSINIVSNLFGKKKTKPKIAVKPDVKQLQSNNLSSHMNPLFANIKAPSSALDLELIQFDSLSSCSPTFTQKSNSDCVSVDSFSSDSNVSSPNGHGSQTESGFEDDFTTSRATTSPADPWDTLEEVFSAAKNSSNLSLISAPIRNYDIINRIRPENTLCGRNLTATTPALNMPTIIKPKILQKPKAPNPPALSNNTKSYSCDDLHPPMPSFDPPPPPAFALQIKEDEEPYGIALYDFQSTQEGDLPFHVSIFKTL